ncbi:MAG: hypothetical protein LBJ11_01070 [Oscillospiraceae bacterium]|jgi:hypothetical protein|nr:hypothetical protein [Oscillospiraceae bacterium]
MLSIIKDISAYELKDEVWSGGLETLLMIMENDKLHDFMDLLAELYPEPVDITTINDLLWFDDDFIFEQLDIEPEDNYTRSKAL